MPAIDRYFNPDADTDGCSPGALAAIQKLYRRALPKEYVELVTRYAGYNDFLRTLDGEEGPAYRISDLEAIESDLAYAAIAEVHAGALPIAGQDAWRLCLLPRNGRGSRIVEIDLGSADIVSEHESIDAFLRDYVSPPAEPSTPFGDPTELGEAQVPAHWSEVLTSRRGPAPADVLARLDIPDDLRDFLEHHDGFDGSYTVPPWDREITFQLGRARTYRSRRSWKLVLDAFPDAVVLGGWDGSSPTCVARDGDGWVWFTPFNSWTSPARPHRRYGATFCEFLAANRASCGE